MEKAVVGLIASLGIIGAIVTKTPNKAKDAESFMADMRATPPNTKQPAWMQASQGKGVRKIPRNKLNFTAFERDLPDTPLGGTNRQDFAKLANANWEEINQFGKNIHMAGGIRNLQQMYQSLKGLYQGGSYPNPPTQLTYISLANQITFSSQNYTRVLEADAVRKDAKKAITAYKKLYSQTAKKGLNYRNLTHEQMKKLSKYAAFKNFMESVFNGAQALTKVRNSSDVSKQNRMDRVKFDEFLTQMRTAHPQNMAYEFRTAQRYVLQAFSNLNYNIHQGSHLATDENAIQGLQNLFYLFANYPFTVKNFNPQDSPLYNLELAMEDDKRVKYIIDDLEPSLLARLYQYSYFFKDNPSIRFVGDKTRPWNKREEMYFTKYASRNDMTTWQVIPDGLAISQSQYKNIMTRRCLKLLKAVKGIEGRANNLARIKKDADRMNRETAKKTVIEQVQTALNGGLVSGRFWNFNTRHSEKSELTNEQKTDLALRLIESPQSNMASLYIYPSAIIKFSYGGIDENGNPIMEHTDTDLMNQRNLLQEITGEEVLNGLKLDPSLKALLETSLRHRYDNAIVQNDRQIAQLASQMNQYLERKKSAQEQYTKTMSLIDFAF